MNENGTPYHDLEVWTDEAFNLNPENPGGRGELSIFLNMRESRRMLLKTETMATGLMLMTRFLRLTPIFDEASKSAWTLIGDGAFNRP